MEDGKQENIYYFGQIITCPFFPSSYLFSSITVHAIESGTQPKVYKFSDSMACMVLKFQKYKLKKKGQGYFRFKARDMQSSLIFSCILLYAE